MKMIVGLGNPEPKYSWTRHNVGKEIVNMAIEDDLGDLSKFWNSCVLRTTGGYMNDIGGEVAREVRYYKVSLSNLMIIYDELDLVVGEYKLDFGKGSRIHNGLLSVERNLGSRDFWHLRIGARGSGIESSVQKTGRDPGKYVLGRFGFFAKRKIQKLYKNSLKKELADWLSKKD